jgi:hypothetical protein
MDEAYDNFLYYYHFIKSLLLSSTSMLKLTINTHIIMILNLNLARLNTIHHSNIIINLKFNHNLHYLTI